MRPTRWSWILISKYDIAGGRGNKRFLLPPPKKRQEAKAEILINLMQHNDFFLSFFGLLERKII
jgi:hypothetical protein